MNSPVYFDTSVFIDIFAKNSPKTLSIRELLKELKQQKTRIYTSIITVQEASVLTYRRGLVAQDNNAAISKLARVWGVDLQISLTAAKREAEICDLCKEKPDESEMKQRRKWDCFHIATAQVLECSRFFTTDGKMLMRKAQLGLPSLEILLPTPSKGSLFQQGLILEAAQPSKD